MHGTLCSEYMVHIVFGTGLMRLIEWAGFRYIPSRSDFSAVVYKNDQTWLCVGYVLVHDMQYNPH